jgi:hypothetical protein
MPVYYIDKLYWWHILLNKYGCCICDLFPSLSSQKNKMERRKNLKREFLLSQRRKEVMLHLPNRRRKLKI